MGIGIAGGFELTGGWNQTSSGWMNTGTDDILTLKNLHVNGYGNYDNSYSISNPSGNDFDVFISVPAGGFLVGGGIPFNKVIILKVRGTTLSVPTSIFTAIINIFINSDKTATVQYDKNDFTIRTTYNETSTDTHIYMNGNDVISGTNLGNGVFYIGERRFGGVEVYGPGLTLKNIKSSAVSVSTSWYGDPVTGFLLAAWNWFQTAVSFMIWDFSYPPEWAFAMNAVYMLFVRIPCYIALFIGIRLLRGTG